MSFFTILYFFLILDCMKQNILFKNRKRRAVKSLLYASYNSKANIFNDFFFKINCRIVDNQRFLDFSTISPSRLAAVTW